MFCFVTGCHLLQLSHRPSSHYCYRQLLHCSARLVCSPRSRPRPSLTSLCCSDARGRRRWRSAGGRAARDAGGRGPGGPRGRGPWHAWHASAGPHRDAEVQVTSAGLP